MDTFSSRTRFLQKLVIDGIAQYDLGSLDADGYDFGKENFIAVRAKDLCRPDLISYRAYGTMEYWWFIMWYNGICDVWNDLAEDQILKFPDIEVVEEFLTSVEKKNDLENKT